MSSATSRDMSRKGGNAETPRTNHGKYKTRLPPIAIDRHLKASLSEQVAEGIRHSIQAGFYKPGDILPPLGALMSQLGISLRVARDAIRMLTDDSLVLARPRVGCQVLQPRAKCHRGRVLAVAAVENMTSYYHAMLLVEVGRLLSEAGVFFETVPLFCSSSRHVDLSPLEDRLRGPVSLVMAYHPIRAISRRLSALSVPYVAVGSRSQMRCTTYVRHDAANARKAFVDACVRRGTKHALVAVYGAHRKLGDDLEAAGIATERIEIPVKFGMKVGESLERDSMDAFVARLGEMRRRKCMPDVVCATDDFITRGALAAFSHLGIELPGGVEFVGAVNDGAAPALPCSLACFRNDPVSNAKTIVDAILRHLNGKSVPHDVFYETEFSFGDTFKQPFSNR